MLNIEGDDKVKAFINLVGKLTDEDYINNNYIILATKRGTIKKTLLEAYSRPRQNGIIAINVKDGDTLLEAKLTTGNSEIMLAANCGKAIRFPESKIRPMGRGASGVRGIRIQETGEVIGMLCIDDKNTNVLVVSENGYGKRSDLEDYRVTNRGGKGVKTINITEKTGKLIALKDVTDEDDLMIINKSGITIRLDVASLRVMGRATQGVRLINLKAGDSIAAVAKVPKTEEEEYVEDEGAEGKTVEGEVTDTTEPNSDNSEENSTENEE
jgi:DNA gyrase subunit A